MHMAYGNWLLQPHFGLSVRVKPTLPKVRNLESSKTPENSKDGLRGQTSSHRCSPSVIGKVLKCRCPKWPRMSHLDICNPSYGQEKDWESNWQFDSRPLKSRESTSSRRALRECNMALESSLWGIQVWFTPCPDRRSGRGATKSQSPGSPNRDNFGTPLRESREKEPFGCHSRGRTQSIL
jgi:hypothetical protein